MAAGTESRRFLDHVGRPRVAITGLGVKTPAGCDIESFTESVVAGRPTAARVTSFDTSKLPSRIACQITDFDASPYAPTRTLRRMDRFTQLGFAAALDAYNDAGSPPVDAQRGAVVSGVCFGGMNRITEEMTTALEKGADFVSPTTVTMTMLSAPGGYITMELGWRGPNHTISTACAAGTDAIGVGAKFVRDGLADVVLAGGTDTAGVSLLMMASFGQAGALSGRNDDPAAASRPFDSDRDGYVIGEGAAYLVLERMDLACARNARIYGEVAGYASTSDAHHISAPHPQGEGARASMTAAITDAGLTPADISQVNCHATSTPLGDAIEAKALLRVFEERQPAVTASKGVFGHLFGAAGAAEAVVAVLSARSGQVPPVAGHQRLGNNCQGIDVVSGASRDIGPGAVLSNSFGLGGQAASVVILPPDEETGRGRFRAPDDECDSE